MGYRWTMTPSVTDPSLAVDAGLPFESRTDAEDWLAATYTDLVADGVETATLTEDDNVIYAMSLLPADTPPVVG